MTHANSFTHYLIQFSIYHTHSLMRQLTPEQKHDLLSCIQSKRDDETVEQIIARHDLPIKRETIWHWQQRWNGTSQSLHHRSGAGRPRVLSKAQVSRHVRPRIVAANRRAEAVHYTQLLPAVQAATGTNVSLSTLRRYGKNDLHASQKHTKKRTAAECKFDLMLLVLYECTLI